MYRYYQPTYVKPFRCDGQVCHARCCRAGWAIELDARTHHKYVALGFDVRMYFNESLEKFCIRPDDDGACPFLDDDLCSIQKKFGEDLLSETCRQYPRQTLDFGDYFERSLSLVCPVAADMILNADRIDFEFIDADESYHRQSEHFESAVPIELRAEFLTLQRTAIDILQRRSLSIVERLHALAEYFTRLDPSVEFGEELRRLDNATGDAIDPIAARRLENYLVHEFFINAYPWRFPLSIESNMKIFLSNAAELLGRDPSLTVEGIRQFVAVSNHDMDFIAAQIKTIAIPALP